MLRSLFLDHPRSLGESYGLHLRRAARFGGLLIAAGACCLVHALLPALHRDTASRTVARLADELQRRRAAS